MGREIILYNVTWESGAWPELQHPVQGDMRGWSLPSIVMNLPGSGPFVDEGDTDINLPPNSSIPPHFVHWRPPIADDYAISPPGHPNTLRLKPSSLNLTGLDGNSPDPGRQTFISRRQVDTLFVFNFVLDYKPQVLNDEAGITLFLTQKHHARLGIAMLPLAGTNTLAPHFRFQAISYIPILADFTIPVYETWLNMSLKLVLRAHNVTQYAFGAGPADGSVRARTLAFVPGGIISWGFTGALLGAYTTSNGGNGSTPAYISSWNYQGWGQVRENWNGDLHCLRGNTDYEKRMLDVQKGNFVT